MNNIFRKNAIENTGFGRLNHTYEDRVRLFSDSFLQLNVTAERLYDLLKPIKGIIIRSSSCGEQKRDVIKDGKIIAGKIIWFVKIEGIFNQNTSTCAFTFPIVDGKIQSISTFKFNNNEYLICQNSFDTVLDQKFYKGTL